MWCPCVGLHEQIINDYNALKLQIYLYAYAYANSSRGFSQAVKKSYHLLVASRTTISTFEEYSDGNLFVFVQVLINDVQLTRPELGKIKICIDFLC